MYRVLIVLMALALAVAGCSAGQTTTPAPAVTAAVPGAAPAGVGANETPAAAAAPTAEEPLIPETGGSPTPSEAATESPAAAAPAATVEAIATAPVAGPTEVASPVAMAALPTSVGLEEVASGFAAPVFLTSAGDGSGRLFVVDQAGTIRVIGQDGKMLEAPFLDVKDRMDKLGDAYSEKGLLGLAFHPDFASNGRFFVYYSAPLRQGAPQGWDHTSHLSEFKVSADDPNRADPNSERVLMQIDEPQGNHNGGTLVFGPKDGYLYLSLGDGGGANDTAEGHTPGIGNAQDISNLLGKIIRIDVNAQGQGDRQYGIPQDNPFANGDGADEIYAYGLRNPYRISFDRGGNNELFAADAGQNLFEEVSIIKAGGDYGWHIKEGTHCFDPNNANTIPAADSCKNTGPRGEPLIDPVIEYQNKKNQPEGIGLVVVGGYVYRGTGVVGLEGHYVFGDWSTSFGAADGALLVATRPDGGQGLWTVKELAIAGRDGGRLHEFVLGFGEDQNGEVYVLTSSGPTGPRGNTGKVYRIVAAGQ